MSPGSGVTDRRIRATADLDRLAFDDRGLVAVVTQDASSGDVLMLAWANRDALERALSTSRMHYWSRSRGELWEKGATSGNTQRLVSLHADCDGDAVLARVEPAGPACHTGDPTCFGAGASADDGRDGPDSVLSELWAILEARDRDRPEKSYTVRLLADENLRLKKLGEETAELIAALARGDERSAEEAADLVYHLMVAVKGAGHSWSEVMDELSRRRA